MSAPHTRDETAGNAMKHSRARERLEIVIAAMLSCATEKEVCDRAGIGRKALWLLKQEPDFQAAFKAAKDQLLESAVNKLRASAVLFVETLSLMAGPHNQNENSRVRAAEVGLSLLVKIADSDTQARIIAIEESLGIEQKHGRTR